MWKSCSAGICLVVAATATGQWGTRGCAAPQAPVGRSRDVYEWRIAGDEQLALFRSGIQIGNWWIVERRYHPFDGKQWGPPCQPPVPVPVPEAQPSRPRPLAGPSEEAPLTGVDWDRVHDDEVFSLNGSAICRQHAFEAMTQVPDWSGRLHLTMIGPEDRRKQLLQEAAVTPWKDRALIQDYPSGHWALAPGFVQEGTQVYLQSRSGEVLARLRGEGITLAALRKADPNYKPDQDADPMRPALGSQLWSFVREQPVAIGGLGGLLLLTLVLALRRPARAS